MQFPDLTVNVDWAAGLPARMQGSSEENKRILAPTPQGRPTTHPEGNAQVDKVLQKPGPY